MPAASYDVMVPALLSTVTEKPLPVTVTSSSRSVWRRAGTLRSGTGFTAGPPVSRASCCLATSKPALAHGVGSLVVKESSRKYSVPGSGFAGSRTGTLMSLLLSGARFSWSRSSRPRWIALPSATRDQRPSNSRRLVKRYSLVSLTAPGPPEARVALMAW